MRIWRRLVHGTIMVVCAGIALLAGWAPVRARVAAPPSATSRAAANAWQEFRPELALGEAAYLCWEVGPRPAGSAAEARAARHLARVLRQLGATVTRQGPLPLGKTGQRTVNVRGLFSASPGAPRFVLGAHYDTLPASGPGADDNASGVGVVREVARVLADQPLPVALEVVCFGGEERVGGAGHHFGSRYYVAHQAPPLAMLSVDMVGYGAQLHAWRWRQRGSYLESLLQRSALALGSPLVVADGPPHSDHTAFAQAGVPALWLEALPEPAYHTAADQPQRLSAAALRRVGQLLVHLLTNLEAEDVALLGGSSAVARR